MHNPRYQELQFTFLSIIIIGYCLFTNIDHHYNIPHATPNIYIYIIFLHFIK